MRSFEPLTYLSTYTVYLFYSLQFTCIKYSYCLLVFYLLLFFIILGEYGHIGKWIQENIIFIRFCCVKLSKNC